jgi:hypothetical protein
MHTKASAQCQAASEKRAQTQKSQIALLRLQADAAKASRENERCVCVCVCVRVCACVCSFNSKHQSNHKYILNIPQTIRDMAILAEQDFAAKFDEQEQLAQSNRAEQEQIAQSNRADLLSKRNHNQAVMDLRRKQILEQRMRTVKAFAEEKERRATAEAELYMSMVGGPTF